MSKKLRNSMRLSPWLLALIMLFGAWLRVDVTLKTQVDLPIRADARDYYSYAYNLVNHGIYSRDAGFLNSENKQLSPDALRSPGYPLFLALFVSHLPIGKAVFDITLAQAVLGTLLVLLTFLAARQCLPPNWALMPAFLVAISPQLVNCGVYVLSETLFIFLMMAGLVCIAMEARKSQAGWVLFAGGLALGAAALVRPTLNYFVPFLLVTFLPAIPKAQRWSWAVKVVLGFALMTIPWTLRNWIVLGGGDQTLLISALVHGHYPWSMYEWNPLSLGYPYRYDPQIADISSSLGAALRGISERVAEHPVDYFVWYFIGKPLMFFSWGDVAAWREFFTYPMITSPYFYNPVFVGTKLAMQGLHAVLVILAVVAVSALVLKRWIDGFQEQYNVVYHLFVATFLYFLAVHVVGFPIARYCVPLLPVIFILAAYMVYQIVQNIRKKNLYKIHSHGRG
ncbi:MAG: glycosyltransferase family 39 protein [Acidovorax sp.]|uniref:glycosyltransferase family 39 protein n=1 Tax=Acidovorax sp. TaxID=1872122 RepID=UPI0039E61DBF